MSLHQKDWLKLIGGAALAATGLGAAGIGPLAGMLSGAGAAGAGTAAAGAGLEGTGATLALGSGGLIPMGAAAGAAGTGGGFANLLGSSLATQGLGLAGSALMPHEEMRVTQPGQIPQLNSPEDPFAWFAQIKQKKGMM